MIKKEDFLTMLNDETRSHRKQFSNSSGVQKNKRKPTFSVPFNCGLVELFQSDMQIALKWNDSHKQFYCFLNSAESISKVEAWESKQGTRVFIRTLLSSATALDLNFADLEDGSKTVLGKLEEAAKHSQDCKAIELCVNALAEAIADIERLRGADLICAVPAIASKEFDLPRELAKQVSILTGKPDITPEVRLDNKVKSAKDCSVDEKWEVWNATTINVEVDMAGKKIILIDDKYQSGVTQHFVGSFLMEAGASEVHSLCLVKTMRDSDNIDVVES